MQPLNYPPRADIDPTALRALIQGQSALQIGYGAVGYDKNFIAVGDISQYMTVGSTIHSDITSTIHRTCNLNIDSDVADKWDYLSGYIKPYQTFTDPLTGLSAQFNLGMYTLTTPDDDISVRPSTLQFSGYDLIYLLQQPIGDTYEVPKGVDPAQAAAEAIALAAPGATVLATPSTSLTATQLTWAFDASQPATWYDVVNSLLAAIGYRQVWVDWDGAFRIEPFVDPAQAQYEWTFDLNSPVNIISTDRTRQSDLFDVPNWWRFVFENLPDTPVEGTTQLTYVDNDPTNPGSYANRGRYVRYIEAVAGTVNADDTETYDYSALQQYAMRTVSDSLVPGEVFALTSQPFPLAWHLDIIQYFDPNLADILPAQSTSRRILATQWEMALDGLTDMSWTWQTVNNNSVLTGQAIPST